MIILKKIPQTINFPIRFSWLLRQPAALLAFGCGVGLSHIMPGTIGSLAALITADILIQLNLNQHGLLLLSLFTLLLGLWSADKTSKTLGIEDYSGIVIDEITAMWLILALVPVTAWYWWCFSFILFRFFDIRKPFPIRQIDAHLNGGLGVMIDDIIAAVYTIGLIWLINEVK